MRLLRRSSWFPGAEVEGAHDGSLCYLTGVVISRRLAVGGGPFSEV
jgi:hypothetical protein